MYLHNILIISERLKIARNKVDLHVLTKESLLLIPFSLGYECRMLTTLDQCSALLFPTCYAMSQVGMQTLFH